MRNVLESIQLFSRKDGADKEYQLRLVQIESGFVVEYSNGKRGSALRSNLKTPAPVTQEVARALYEKTKKEKLRDGYTGSESGESFVGTEFAGRKTNFAPHLLTACDEEKARQLIADPNFVAQIKHDGERRYVAYKDGKTTFANRSGLEVPGKEEIVKSVEYLAAQGFSDFELDCEDMGSYLETFDILSIDGVDLRDKGFSERFKHLGGIELALRRSQHGAILRIVEILHEVDLDYLRANGFEGVCFKRTNGKYVNGRNEDQYKLKFWENATVRVKSKHATKSSVAIEVLNESNQWVGVGNVTEPANVPRPLIAGDLIDVRYLYAYQGGSLFEPTFDKIRDDLKESDALMSQLKFKRTAQAA